MIYNKITCWSGWTDLIQILYTLKHSGVEISTEAAENLHYLEKTTLINEDAVTCAIYFNKLVNVLMSILQSKKLSPENITLSSTSRGLNFSIVEVHTLISYCG